MRLQTITHALRRLFFGIVLTTIATGIHAQELDATLHKEDAPAANEKNITPPSDNAQSAAQAPGGKLSRWFELQTALLYIRYRFVENSARVTTANQSQHKESFKARFKFDSGGKYSLNAGLFSGRTFIGTWNNTGWGTGQAQSNLALKQLFFAAAPVEGLEVQYGGLYILRGDSTEITSYDEDGYIVGQRLSLKRPDKLFFDEISVTYAYHGDINTPNLNKRYHRLKQSNYHQFLVEKKLGKRAAVSADYTFESGRETLREAVKLNLRETHLLDTLRFENYERLNPKAAYGFALHGEKAVTKRLTLGGGYAQIDPAYGNLNADRFLTGKRFFLLTSLQITSEISVATYATRAVANSAPVAQRTRLDLILSYNLLKGLQRTGWF